ncbi:ABC transporter ATP-binding protein [Echinicola salinicaeni]|uniref:ABC transporter ATP-binding protein n=1 Tax=Echinicola salinicaeni TaxID=2762757 RepID=UPI001648A023|nr:ABC transporter ATP-binding protein [Echinicola salinicaeni]
MLKATGIQKYYGDLHVLKGVDISIQSGEIVSIVGASGAGKSTLLHILGTLDKADGGEVIVGNKNLGKLKGDKLAAYRNSEIGFIFQFHNLLPEFTAEENIMIPGLIAKKDEQQLRKKALELAKLLGIEGRLSHKPSELSGGEQQRVAVARALINDPKIIFADEPSGNLDTQSAEALHELFFKLRDSFGQSFVIVTHNKELAQMADRMLTMQDGIIISEEKAVENLS